MSLGDLHGVATGGRDHVKLVPAIQVGQERDPFAIGRRLGLGFGFPIGQAPEFVFFVLVDGLRRASGDRGNINRPRLVSV